MPMIDSDSPQQGIEAGAARRRLMAQLKGKGAFTAVNLLAKTYDNNVTSNDKTRFIVVMVDHRDERGRTQTNLHLTSQRTQDPDGKTRCNNGAPYSASQFERIVAAAGSNSAPITDSDGREIGRVYGLKCDLIKEAGGRGLALNTETLGQSDFTVDDKTLIEQYTAMAANRRAARAQVRGPEYETRVPAPQATAAAGASQAPEVAEEEPALG